LFVILHKNFPDLPLRQKPRACQSSLVGARLTLKVCAGVGQKGNKKED
jgi:hypothetical protein